jgi:endonuclease V-like protein UPF0215 family
MELRELVRRGRRLRTLGIDDGPFERRRRGDVLVVGAVYSAWEFEGLISTRVRQDGFNATRRLIAAIRGSKFQAQLHMVMLDGITLGGFNVVDLPALAEAVAIPCAAVVRREPDLAAVAAVARRLSNPGRRLRALARAGPIHRAGDVCFQVAGAAPEVARAAIRASVVRGVLPECLRGAHLIASGLVTGESGRRA